MSSGSILLAIALLVAVGMFITFPLLMPRVRRRQDVLNPEWRRLSQEKAQLLSQLRALEFDWETGKLPDDVYGQQRADLSARAADVLRRLDEIAVASPAVAAIDDEVEAAIARQRQVPPKSPAPAAVSPAPAATNGAKPAPSRFCPQCGRSVDLDDRFCASCGHALARKATPET